MRKGEGASARGDKIDCFELGGPSSISLPDANLSGCFKKKKKYNTKADFSFLALVGKIFRQLPLCPVLDSLAQAKKKK